MRKWTKSACVVLAWGILPILVAVGGQSPVHRAQAIHHFTSSTAQVTLTTFRGVAEPTPAANKQAIGPNSKTIRVGMLLAAGVVIGLALATEPVIAMGARRTRDRRTRRAVEKAGIVMTDYDRLIVAYCLHDDTVYVLTPPGADPRAVLRAARLVVPEEKYQELAGQLSVSAEWSLE